MIQPPPGRPTTFDLRSRANEIRAFQDDPAQPGRPLHLLLAGAAIALVAMVFIVSTVYQGWYERSISEDRAIFLTGLLFFPYAGGVYLFSYGYELYDVAKALRLTAIIVALSVAAVFVLAAFFYALRGAKGGGGAVSASTGGGKTDGILGTVTSYIGDGSGDEDDDTAWMMMPRPGFPMHPYQLPAADPTITCGQCHSEYLPSPPLAACPFCGWRAVTVA